MNLGQLRTAIQARGYGTDTVTHQNQLINSVYRRVSAMHQWPWLEVTKTFSTTPGTDTYTFSGLTVTDFVHAQSLRIYDSVTGEALGSQLYLRPQDFYDIQREAVTASGTPEAWTVDNANGQIVLWPIPDVAYSVEFHYVKRPPELSADGDTPLMDSEYHDVLVWGAVKDLAYRERDTSGYSIANSEYLMALKEMERAYGVKNRQNSSQVRRSGHWHWIGAKSGQWY